MFSGKSATVLRLCCLQVLVGNMWSVTVLPLWFQSLYILQVTLMVCTSSKADNFMRLVIVFGSISSLGYGAHELCRCV